MVKRNEDQDNGKLSLRSIFAKAKNMSLRQVFEKASEISTKPLFVIPAFALSLAMASSAPALSIFFLCVPTIFALMGTVKLIKPQSQNDKKTPSSSTRPNATKR